VPSGDIIVVCEVVCLHVRGSRGDVRHICSKRVGWTLFEGHLRCRVFIMIGVDSDDVLRQLSWREVMEEDILRYYYECGDIDHYL
jgi:hypothetical protein